MAKKAVKMRGKGNEKDTPTKIVFQNNEWFAEVFNHTHFRDCPISASELEERDTAEAVMLDIGQGKKLNLQKQRDVTKYLGQRRLAILGVEDQNKIDYQMPFRVMTNDFLSYARQVSEIMERNNREWRGEDGETEKAEEARYHPTPGELLSAFRKDDRITPTETLVIYYGEEPWDGPRSLRDMFVESPWMYAASDYEMQLLDIRRMTEEEIDTYSGPLRVLFRTLKHFNDKDELLRAIKKDQRAYQNASKQILDALEPYTNKEVYGILCSVRSTTEEGKVDMDKGFRKVLEKEKEEGRKEGRKEVWDEAQRAIASANQEAQKEVAAVREAARTQTDSFIHNTINMLRNMKIDDETILDKILTTYSIPRERALEFMQA